MQVWELITQLSKCPAGANVSIGVNATMNVDADSFEIDGGEVSIRSSKDVECCQGNGNTDWLSNLVATNEGSE